VDLACHQLFAAAAFTEDQHTGVVGGGGVDQAVDPLLRLGLADDLAAFLVGTALPTQALILGREQIEAERLFHHAAQLDGVERLLDVIVGTFLESVDGGLDGGMAGDQHDLGLRVMRFHELEQIEAVGARHAEIGEHNGGIVVFEKIHRLVRVLGAGHLERHRRLGQHGEDQLTHVAVILGNQNGRDGIGRAGILVIAAWSGGILFHDFARSRSTAGSLTMKHAPSPFAAS